MMASQHGVTFWRRTSFFRLAEMIADGIVKIRDTLDDVTQFMPKDEYTRREYAQRFLEATENSDEKRASPKKG